MVFIEMTVNLVLAALVVRSEEHTSELQSQSNLVCRLLLEKINVAIAVNAPFAAALGGLSLNPTVGRAVAFIVILVLAEGAFALAAHFTLAPLQRAVPGPSI